MGKVSKESEMNELIVIGVQQVGDGIIKTVNARNLHAFLEVGKDFSNWIKDRVRKYGFLENQDFVVSANSGENLNGGRPSIDYHISIDMAKELSMVERNAKGKEARQYFLECERQALSPVQADPIQLLNDPAAMRGLLLAYSEKVLALEETVASQAPKVQALERISNADGMENITNTAKALQIRPKDLFNYLSEKQWIYRRVGGKGWVAYQTRIQQGLLAHKVTTVKLSDGTEKMIENVLVTPKGVAKLAHEFALVN